MAAGVVAVTTRRSVANWRTYPMTLGHGCKGHGAHYDDASMNAPLWEPQPAQSSPLTRNAGRHTCPGGQARPLQDAAEVVHGTSVVAHAQAPPNPMIPTG